MDGIGLLSSRRDQYYFGEFFEGAKSGLGKYVWDSSVYIGQFKENFKDGLGEMYNNSGVYIIGIFGDDKINGFACVYDNTSKQKLSGYFKNGEVEGIIIESRSNSKFIGHIKNGLREGVGKVAVNDSITFFGNFTRGKKNGFGIEYLSMDEFFEGEFSEDMRYGWGKEMSHDSGEYFGQYLRDSRDGLGRWKSTSGRLYIGMFKGGLEEGLGWERFDDEKDTYFGFWKDGKKHGVGYQNVGGREYRGEFKEGLYNGMAILKIPDSEKVYGYFRNNKLIQFVSREATLYLNENAPNLLQFLEDADLQFNKAKERIESQRKHLQLDHLGIQRLHDRESTALDVEATRLRTDYLNMAQGFERASDKIDYMLESTSLTLDLDLEHVDLSLPQLEQVEGRDPNGQQMNMSCEDSLIKFIDLLDKRQHKQMDLPIVEEDFDPDFANFKAPAHELNCLADRILSNKFYKEYQQ